MKPYIRKTCITIILFTALVVAGCAKHPPAAGPVPPPPLAAAPEDRKIIVAKVNGADITRHSLINMMSRMSEINKKTSTSESTKETRMKALDQLIFRELAAQEAEREGLRVDEQRLDDAMNKFITSVGHEAGFKDFLEKQGLTSVEVRSQIERNLLLQLIASREVAAKVSISDDEVRKEYDSQKDQFITPEKVSVVDVVFFLKQDDEAAMKKVNEILAKINADKDKNPLNVTPDGTFIVRSLDIDKEKEPALYSAARKLKTGEISGVINTSDSIHIIQLSQYTPEKQTPYEEVKESLKQKLLAAAQIKRFQDWEQELKKGAKIELMDDGIGQEQRKP